MEPIFTLSYPEFCVAQQLRKVFDAEEDAAQVIVGVVAGRIDASRPEHRVPGQQAHGEGEREDQQGRSATCDRRGLPACFGLLWSAVWG